MALKLVCFLALFIHEISGHGYMVDPPGRSSAWRFFDTARKNYNDNAVFCGGFATQWYTNGGRCGVCGDSYTDPHPQKNENTGIYGQGIVVASYEPGSIINTQIIITANHKGYFNFSLCVIDDPNAPESGEECFEYLKLDNGEYEHPVDININEYEVGVQLPEGVTCERCVLRWTYRAGNNWGFCEDGTGRIGCGPQEHFRSCADIAIYEHI